MKLADRTDIPSLDGWVNLTEVADMLGVTRSYVYKMASRTPDEGGFNTLHRIGTQASYIVSRDEVQNLIEGRAQKKEEAPKEEKVKTEKKPRAKKPKPAVVEDGTPEPVVTDAQPVAVFEEPSEETSESEEELSIEDILAQI